MYALLNMMAAEKGISFTCTASVLGYCLLPMALLSMLAAVLSLKVWIVYFILLKWFPDNSHCRRLKFFPNRLVILMKNQDQNFLYYDKSKIETWTIVEEGCFNVQCSSPHIFPGFRFTFFEVFSFFLFDSLIFLFFYFFF